MTTILLLTLSNIFMTFAWYGYLRFKEVALWKVILISWGIAFFEYCLMVPANRWGHQQFSAAQLKTLQEVITLLVFCGFSVLYLREPLRWNYLVGFALIIAATGFVFLVREKSYLRKLERANAYALRRYPGRHPASGGDSRDRRDHQGTAQQVRGR